MKVIAFFEVKGATADKGCDKNEPWRHINIKKYRNHTQKGDRISQDVKNSLNVYHIEQAPSEVATGAL